MNAIKILVSGICIPLLVLVLGFASVVYLVRSTLVDPEFLYSEIEASDPARAIRGLVIERLPPEASAIVAPAVEEALAEHEQTLLAQMRKAATDLTEYLRGSLDRVQVTIDTAPIVRKVAERVEQRIKTEAPPELNLLPPAERQKALTMVREAASGAFKGVEAVSFDTDQLSEAAQYQMLRLRRGIRFLDRDVLPLAGAAVVLALLVMLSTSMRTLGAILLVFGLVLLVPVFFSTQIASLLPHPAADSLPTITAAYLPTFYSHVAAPLEPIAYGAIGLAVVLFIGGLIRAAAAPPPPRRSAHVSVPRRAPR